MPKKRAKKKPSGGPDFEEALEKLEAIVADLEEGSGGLAESMKQYEEGVRLLRHCHGLLQTAQRKIELVTGVDEQGNPVSAPMDDSDQSLSEKAKRPTRHRAMRPSSPTSGGDDHSDGTGMDASEGLF